MLDRVRSPHDLRKLEERELGQFADELRQEVLDKVALTGGHLGAGLGVVELTTAMHYVFETPRDTADLGRRRTSAIRTRC